jgi:hypothetical protein
MNCRIARSAFTIVFAAGLIMTMATRSYADDRCSLARSAGHWSLTDNGTVIGIGPRTAVGVFTLDGNGNLLNGVAASSLNGSVASETFSGTYTVNPDCSGSFDVKIYSGGVELFELTAFTAFDNDMREMRAVFTSIVAPNGTALQSVINLQARKQ